MHGFAQYLLEELNPEQQKAVRHTEGPLLIMAGAGSGKTRVLTHRIAYLLAEKGVAPWNIVAITFTNKAAREMKERISQLTGGAAEQMAISTFHALCVRILRKDIDRLGVHRQFTILDAQDQLSVIKQILKELNFDSKKFPPRSLLGTISAAKNKLWTAEEYGKRRKKDLYTDVALEVYQEYEKRLLKNHALDFDDLIFFTVRLFQRVPEVLEYYQRKFQYIHVDEYQDTNTAQYQLVRLLGARFQNVCVVGDSDQSIYKWRGADIRNILSFEKDYPQAAVIYLEQNYRSTKTILNAANEVIRHNSNRKPKKLWTKNDTGAKVCFYEAEDEYDEARYVTGLIRRMQEKGESLENIAVLYRTNAQSRAMEEALVQANVPYRIFGATRFYERKEIKDVLAYLRLVANHDDDISFTRIVNVPRRGIGRTTLERLERYAAEHGVSLFAAACAGRDAGVSTNIAKKLIDFTEMIKMLAQLQEELPVTELVEKVLEETEYRAMLAAERTLEARSRMENIDELLTVTKTFEAENQDRSLLAFLTELALDSEPQDEDQDSNENGAVTLMTLHAAKGLEFPTVVIIGMEEGIFPHYRSLFDEEEMEEERRLAYVGMTRAERRLYLTSARNRTLFGRTEQRPLSRFIEEIPESFVERIEKEREGQGRFRLPRKSAAPKSMQSKISGTSSYDWSVGDRVQHRKWGTGVVVSKRGANESLELDIAFPQVGVKRLLAQFAPIEKAK